MSDDVRMISLRLPQEFIDALDVYALERKTSRTQVLLAAGQHFLDLAKSGVPDLPEPEPERPTAVGGVPPPRPFAPRPWPDPLKNPAETPVNAAGLSREECFALMSARQEQARRLKAKSG